MNRRAFLSGCTALVLWKPKLPVEESPLRNLTALEIEQMEASWRMVSVGIKSVNEVRGDLGLPPVHVTL